MAQAGIKKRRFKNAPGITVECKSGRYLAFYEHRTNIIAHGDSEIEAKKNLKKMYEIVMKHEKEEEGKEDAELLSSFKTKRFKEKIPS